VDCTTQRLAKRSGDRLTARSRGFRNQNQSTCLSSVCCRLSLLLTQLLSYLLSLHRSLLRAALAPNPPVMARPPKEAIDTFISITGADEAVAVRKLEVPPKGLSLFLFTSPCSIQTPESGEIG
jgi:hypothetical protein